MLHSNMIVDIEDNTFQDLTSLQVNPFSPLAFGQNSLTSRILVCDTLLLRIVAHNGMYFRNIIMYCRKTISARCTVYSDIYHIHLCIKEMFVYLIICTLVQYNILKPFPYCITYCISLSLWQVLKMSFNKIKKINKGTFKGLESLMRLYLDHNQIEFINPEAFYGLTNLQLVHLESNHLQQLHPDTFITMRYNQVFKVSSVRTLHLSDNQLETLPVDVFSGCSKLENLFLHGNPWACDCRMNWFAGWAQKNTGEKFILANIYFTKTFRTLCFYATNHFA